MNYIKKQINNILIHENMYDIPTIQLKCGGKESHNLSLTLDNLPDIIEQLKKYHDLKLKQRAQVDAIIKEDEENFNILNGVK